MNRTTRTTRQKGALAKMILSKTPYTPESGKYQLVYQHLTQNLSLDDLFIIQMATTGK